MPRPQISLQLYSLRDLIKEDFASTINEVAKIGFKGVETAGYGDVDYKEAHAILSEVGLQVSGQHVSFDALRNNLPQVAREALYLRTKHVVCPSTPAELFHSPESCMEIGQELNEIGARLRGYGLHFHYHNHGFEQVLLNGRHGLDWLLDAAEPRNLFSQPDVYWLQVGKNDPARFIRRQGQRIRLVHIKDEKEIGAGPVNFREVFASLDAVDTTEWYVIEVERYTYTPLESVRRSFEQMKVWGRT